MTRTVGSHPRTEFTLDPLQALRQGRRVDAMLASASLPHPRGVIRATHRALNALDDARQVEAARRLQSTR